MRKVKILPALRHSAQMVLRTWKCYALLSVTIVLSFSLLLGYLTFTDTIIYNENKELFSYRRQDLCFYIQGNDIEKVQLLVDKLSAMEATTYYLAYNYYLGSSSIKYEFQLDETPEWISLDHSVRIGAVLFPDYSWPDDVASVFSDNRHADIVWLDGEKHQSFILEQDQAIVSEALYRTLQMDQQENPVFPLNLQYGQKIPLRVVGYYQDVTFEIWEEKRKEYSDYWDTSLFQLILSNKFIDYAKLYDKDYYGAQFGSQHIPQLLGLYLQVYSETPELVLGLYESICGQEATAIYQLQNDALDEIRPQKQVKAIITCALLLILGVNLYSCFTNALNDRKFEIGVKRALGASAFSIVRQFLYESCIVMAANILLSVSLVTDVAVVYKFIVEHTPDEKGAYPDFILYLSPYSAAMFGICAVSLTIVFSLIFAYKTTRVEIVQYLKAE